jgi:hypothetical protein
MSNISKYFAIITIIVATASGFASILNQGVFASGSASSASSADDSGTASAVSSGNQHSGFACDFFFCGSDNSRTSSAAASAGDFGTSADGDADGSSHSRAN